MRLFHAFLLTSLMCVFGCTMHTTEPNPQPAAPAPTGVLGKDGKISFSFHSNTGSTTCLFCSVMKGTEENVRMDPPPTGVTVESSDPTVVTVAAGTVEVDQQGNRALDGFVVDAKGVGVVEIRIKSSAGQILDRIDLGSEAPTKVTFSSAPQTVAVGTTINVVPSAIGSDGKPLQSSTGWTFAGDAPAIADVENGCAVACYGNADWMTVKGLAAGKVNATATGGGTVGTVAVTVTP
jgi:hypothetical protein